MTGDTVDNAQLANFTRPLSSLRVNGIDLDMNKLAEAAQRLLGGVNEGDVISVSGHRNAKGEFIPDYETVRIERA